MTRQQTHNAQAYAAYVKGMYIWGRRGSQVVESLPYFRQAIELDPNFLKRMLGWQQLTQPREFRRRKLKL